jgi:hypothetical protein
MNLELRAIALNPESTLSSLHVDGAFECFVLEDRVRPDGEAKVPGETAIPAGTYEVRITHSPKFKRDVPLLLGVPGFVGIRIHPGNTAADSRGCLLPGRTASKEFVGESTRAYTDLFRKLETGLKAGPVFITITR